MPKKSSVTFTPSRTRAAIHIPFIFACLAFAMAASSNSASVSAPDHMIVSPEYCALLEKVQCIADSMWLQNGSLIAGVDGFEAVKLLGVCKSHPAFPIFVTALSTMPSLANGISIRLWSTKGSKSKGAPVVMPVFNGNYSQTRTFDCVCVYLMGVVATSIRMAHT